MYSQTLIPGRRGSAERGFGTRVRPKYSRDACQGLPDGQAGLRVPCLERQERVQPRGSGSSSRNRSQRMRMRRRRWLVIGLGICWLAAVTAGLVLLHGYAAQAGQRGVAPTRWPVDSPIDADPSRVNLVMWLHPSCPCSRAEPRATGEDRGSEWAKAAHSHRVHRMPAGRNQSGVLGACGRAAANLGANRSWRRGGAPVLRAYFGSRSSLRSRRPARLQRRHYRPRGHEGSNPGTDAVLDFIEGRGCLAGIPCLVAHSSKTIVRLEDTI